MRIAVAALSQETNTFLPVPTEIADFEDFYLYRGDELLTRFGPARVEVPGFLSVLAEAGITPVPLLAAVALAGGPVSRHAFETLAGELMARLEAAGPVDGLLLSLHGAMVLEDAPDAEGLLLSRLRARWPALPIGVSLDLHGHIRPLMLQPDVVLIGYREYPHIDMFETGERVARLLLSRLLPDRRAGPARPVMAMARRPLLVSPIDARTGHPPLSRIVARARAMEAAGEVLHASLFPVQPWLDVPELGFTALVCALSEAAAQQAADELADMAWQARDDFEPDLTPLDEAIRIGLASAGTTVVGDGGDAPSSGSAADHTGVLRALLAAGADRAGRLTYLTLCDPEAAAIAAAAGIGATVTLSVGHKKFRDAPPLEITGRVRTLTDGVFTMQDQGMQGAEVHTGLTAVIAIGDLRLALRSLKALEWDTGLYHSVGLPLQHAALVFVKSPSHFRVSYAPHAARMLAADTPGTTRGNMRALVFKHVTRPLYPLDDFPDNGAPA